MDNAGLLMLLRAALLTQEEGRVTMSVARVRQIHDGVAELIEAAARANGGHTAPHDCYATGPLTGNPIADLVACPGCALANVLAKVTP